MIQNTFDMMGNEIEDLKKILIDFSPNFVAISLRNIDDVNSLKNNVFISKTKDVVDTVREFSKAIIIIGGSGYSIFPELITKFVKPDFGIIGEGEISLTNLLKSINKGKIDYYIPGLVHQINQEIIINPNNNSITDVYLNYDYKLLDYYWAASGMINIQTKRGCPFNCIYCTYPIIEGNKVRCLNNDSILETIAKLKRDKGYDYFFFTDSVFNIHPTECIDLAENLIKSKVNIKWGAYFSPFRMKYEEMAIFKKAGLTHIEFGTDSLSDDVLAAYNKPFRFEDVVNASEIADKLNIFQAHFLIFNGVGETIDTIQETIYNSQKLGKTVLFPFWGMRIYPNTELEKIAFEKQRINEKIQEIEPLYYYSIDMDIEHIKSLAKQSNKRWVFPDEDFSRAIEKMRKKNKKGPLWEYLI